MEGRRQGTITDPGTPLEWLSWCGKDQDCATPVQGTRWDNGGTGMADSGIQWRRDAEKALDEAKQSGKRALVDFTAAPL